MGKPASNYSWPQFKPGDETALKHGARSRDGRTTWRPLADALAAAALVEAPWLSRPAFAWALAAWSVVEAKARFIDDWLDANGLLDDDGIPRPANNQADRLHTRASSLRARLGLDPTAFAALVAAFVSAPGTEDILAALRAEGRAIMTARAPEALQPAPGAAQPPEAAGDEQ